MSKSPSPEPDATLLYQKRTKIHPRSIKGRFQRWRFRVAWPLMLAFFLLPWFNWESRQSILFDLSARQFHWFGLSFWPQDLSLLGLVLIVSAFGLFFITALYGRVWCGYACPQTVWTSVFLWIEQKIEGSRNQRIRLDAQVWNREKWLKKVSKHSLWWLFAFASSFTFIGYFYGVRDLASDLAHFSVNGEAVVWLSIVTGMTYLAAGWLREQVCQYMCPYARFQSVMFEPDTLIVAYDANRGEPRGPKSEVPLGACIDCHVCVQVCPAGIDIRDGLQHECIGCALCIDACDEVMTKIQAPTGLIRYATETELAEPKPFPVKVSVEELSRAASPATPQAKAPQRVGFKTYAYGVAFALACAFLVYRLVHLTAVEMTVMRDRGQTSSVSASGLIQNSYQLKLVNKRNQSVSFRLSLQGLPSAQLLIDQPLVLQANQVLSVPVRIGVEAQALSQSVTPVSFVFFGEHGETLQREARFIHLTQGDR